MENSLFRTTITTAAAANSSTLKETSRNKRQNFSTSEKDDDCKQLYGDILRLIFCVDGL